MKLQYTLATILLILLAFSSCKEEQVAPPNPFDAIDYGEIDMPEPEPDPNSLVGLHTYIFSQRCATPACHDGSFEPDFRTVQSTYSTLVYHPLVKQDTSGYFIYRVAPFDIEHSWLHERLTTTDGNLGRMPLYDDPLSPEHLQNIENWINAGAPDMFGNVSALPNSQPMFNGMVAFLDIPFLGEVRVDTIREQIYYPFGTLTNNQLTIWLDIQDDSTAVKDLLNSRIKFSADFDDFSSAMEVNAVYSPTPKVVPDYYGSGMPGNFYWNVTVNTAAFPVNEITFMRFYAEDGSHSDEFEFPRTEHPIEFKAFMSFFVAP